MLFNLFAKKSTKKSTKRTIIITAVRHYNDLHTPDEPIKRVFTYDTTTDKIELVNYKKAKAFDEAMYYYDYNNRYHLDNTVIRNLRVNGETFHGRRTW